MRNHRFSLRAAGILLGVPLALALTVGLALGHHVISLSGTVDCDGNYTVFVSANVYGQTTLTTRLDGITIGTETPGGGNGESDNYGNHDFMYTGTGAEEGQSIQAKVSDSQAITTAYLVLTQEVCEEATPEPTPVVTPDPTPVVTPVVTPSETPIATPSPSIPDTAVELPNVGGPIILFAGFMLIGMAILVIVHTLFGRRTR